MTLQQLHYIIGVSESGSLNKAAENLYVSQPSLTSAIKEVENKFSISNLNRSSNRIYLTQDVMEIIRWQKIIQFLLMR